MLKKIFPVLFTVVFMFSCFSACSPSTSAVMTVGGTEISAQEFNYNYYAQIQDFYAAYSGYLSYFGLDPETPLREQSCSISETEQTWADFFMDRTEELLTQVFSFYNAALEQGMELGEESLLQLDAFILSATESAAKKEQSLDEYLSDNYGEGLNEELYREFLSHRLLATQYRDEVLGRQIYTDEQYEAYYQENRETIDRLTFRVYTLTEDCLPADSSAVTEEEVSQAVKALAESFANGLTTQDQFMERAIAYAPEGERENYQSPSSTLAKNVKSTDLSDTSMKEWLFDAARVSGEVSVHQTAATSYTVCMYLSRGRDEENLASMRHILLSITKSEEGSNEAEVFESIKDIYSQWEREAFSEESFIALVEEHSEDPGSTETGGLYENFPKGYMVSEIDDWLYAPGRKKGDSDILKTSYGYHLVWFTGYGEVSWKSECLPGLQDEDYYRVLEDLGKKYSVTYAENYHESIGNDD